MLTPVIKSSGMDKEMESEAVHVTQEALKEYTEEQDVAHYIKKSFEDHYGSHWHCFVGRNFSSFVTHEKGKHIYFYIGQTGVMLFATP